MPQSRWPALVIHARRIGCDDLVAALLDDFEPAAIEDLAFSPIPPGGLWDPTFDAPPDPPPAPLQWRVFFSTGQQRNDAAAALHAANLALSIESTEVSDDNWAARSQRALTAIQAGQFVVAPPWDRPQQVEPGVTTIVIEPSRGFGTGHHQSTRLCLRALSALDLAGTRVLDLGTGSGVLAMAAAFKGARDVVAVDVDGEAIAAARESAELNDLPIAIEFVVADFRTQPRLIAGAGCGSPLLFDLVVANLTGGMLTTSAADVRRFVAPGGVLVMSGFDESEREPVTNAFGAMTVLAHYQEDGWVGLVFRS